MQCGAKCFIVTVEKEDGLIEEIQINARTPILARKTARSMNEKQKIVSVRKK